MNKRKLIKNLGSIHTLLCLSNSGGNNLAKRKLVELIDTLESELIHDDTVVFRGQDCSDLIGEYQRGYIDFGVFIAEVRRRGGGTIAELKEFAEPFRVKEVA